MKTLKITAVSPFTHDVTKKKSFAINVVYNDSETVIWRSEKQFAADVKRSFGVEELSDFDRSHLTGGELTGNIIAVNAGDKYSVQITDDEGKTSTEEREYTNDGLQVTDGFLSLERNFKQNAAVEMAKLMMEKIS